MFAEKQRSELMDLLKKNKNYRPTPIIPSAVPATFGKALLEVGKKYLVDVIKSIDIHHDPCNILVTSDLGTYWYRNPYCQPPPVPKNLSKQLTDLDLSHCGSIAFWFTRAAKITGYEEIPGTGGGVRQVSEPISIEEIYAAHIKYNKQGDGIPPTLEEFVESGGSTGSGGSFNVEGGTTSYFVHYGIGGQINSNQKTYSYPFNNLYLPYYSFGWGIVEVHGSDLSGILSKLEQGSKIPIKVYKIDASNAANVNCLINKPTPDPPPPKDCDCMSCCCPQQKYDDTLLKLILQRIGEPKEVEIFDEDLTRTGAQKTNKTPENLNEYFKLAVERIEIANRIIGIENFPVTVPDTVIEPHKEGLFASIFKFIDGEKKIQINSVTELIGWMVKQDSAVLGEFHQVIQSETGEKDKKGKPVISTTVLPNVAESLKEIVLLTAQMAKQNNIQTELLFKMAAEIIATRAAATKGTTISQDIQDYLDYPTNTKKARVQTAVSLPKFTTNKEGIPVATGESESHENFLKSGEIQYVYDDWTGSNSLHDQLLDLLQLASMLRAIYFQRTDKIESEIE